MEILRVRGFRLPNIGSLRRRKESNLTIGAINEIDWSKDERSGISGSAAGQWQRPLSGMTMMNLYFHATPNSMKVAVQLHELNLPFDITPFDIFKGAQHSPDFRVVNPNGKVPPSSMTASPFRFPCDRRCRSTPKYAS
ncbi:glutathione S-transferase N-terminal domain-containing protein [Oryzicola mucosus]|uniref:glutathione S-transferase N-terminal domain-containing protein n=1 Tax=Oryzicola mucosus TaxID=2767425 RepID=UPI001AEE48D4|nr:glutathione S-transferase N-terminal domain-containing protein [Oryzicola mucosus]